MNDSPTSPPARLFSRERGDIAARLSGLSAAVEAARGRLDDHLVDAADGVVERASSRLRLSAEHTIVALAGATGSGKSSLFNALAGIDLAGVGVRRPTTSWALACAWGPEGATEILEWIGIPARHQASRMSMLDAVEDDDTNLEGLVLLDLPDHDSTEVAHHLEVDRLVVHADLLVWVLDPQKYADAAVHERYLRPLAGYSDVMMVVLNQIDQIPSGEWRRALSDVRRLLVEDGLPDVALLGTSAVRGDGVEDLKRVLVRQIRDKKSAAERIEADVDEAAERLVEVSGTAAVPSLTDADRYGLDVTLAECAGVPVIVDAIGRSTARRASLATSWLVVRWVQRLRRDPAKEVELDIDLSAESLAASSIPEPARVQRASVDVAVRDLADQVSEGLAHPWRRAVRAAGVSGSDELTERIDRAVEGTDLELSRRPRWWTIANLAQWALLAVAVVGLGWLAYLAAVSYMRLDPVDTPSLLGVPVPTLMLVGGLVLGLLAALAAAMAARRHASTKAQRADRLLRSAISEVAQECVIEPLQTELTAYDACRAGLAQARGDVAGA